MVDESVVLDRIREILTSVMELEDVRISVDESFHLELEMDSLQKIEIVTRIERAFDLQLEPEEVANMDSLGDVLTLLRERTGAIPGGAR